MCTYILFCTFISYIVFVHKHIILNYLSTLLCANGNQLLHVREMCIRPILIHLTMEPKMEPRAIIVGCMWDHKYTYCSLIKENRNNITCTLDS